MTWPRAMRCASSVVCGTPNGTSSTPSSTWRNGRRKPRHTPSKSHRPRGGARPVPPRAITGRGGGRAWRQHLSKVSRILPPWRLTDSIRQTSQEVEEQWRAALKAIETLLETNGLPMKQATLDKVRKQLAGISALVDCWWQTVHQDLAQMAMTPKWTQWADALLLPLMYWQEQLRRMRCPGQKAQVALVLQAVEEAFARHPCTRKLTPELLADWKAWAAEHAKAFQRASSAVESRNRYLLQMQHNHRGLP